MVSQISSPRSRFALRSVQLAAVVLLLAAATSFADETKQATGESLKPVWIDPPAPPGTTSPAIVAEDPTTVSREHELLMTWLEPGEYGGTLKFSRLSGESWSRPITITDGVSMLDPGDRPSVTVLDTQAVRRTLIARTGSVIGRSGDGGRTWGKLPADPLPYASFAGGDEGGYAFWLARGDGDLPQLLGTRILAGGAVLDERVAPDVQTGAAMTWDGPVVAYRAKNTAGALDLAVVTRENAQWTKPRLLHADGWRPAKETRSGPMVAALKRDVAVAWYTEADSNPRVRVAFSKDAGRSFGKPVEVDAGGSGYTLRDSVDVALDDDGTAFVLWMAVTGTEDLALNLARVSADGRRGKPFVVRKIHPTRMGGMPQIARAGPRLAAAWMEGVLRRVRAVAIPIQAVPALGTRRPPTVLTTGTKSKPKQGRGKLGDPAPEVNLVSIDGKKVSLDAHRGRAVLLNLWATWCVPCLEEMPELAKLHDRFGPQGLDVIGVNVDDAKAIDQVHAFIERLEVPFDIWLDPEMSVAKSVRVHALPATFLIDPKGEIVFRKNRDIKADDPELAKALEQAIPDAT